MNKTVVVTGATGALGSLTAKTFAARGYHLVLLDKDGEKLSALTRDLNLPAERLLAQTLDLSDESAAADSARSAASKFGSIHGLIHLVGGWTGGKTIAESSKDDLALMLQQHVWTTFFLFKAFAPLLADKARAILVSQPLTIRPAAKSSLYAAAKSAQESLAFTLAEDYRERGVAANVIHVKAIDADGSGKGTSPAEIVAAMEYLFSEAADKVNGARIPLY